jgi:arginase
MTENFFIAACCSAGQKKFGVELGPLNLDIKYNHIITQDLFFKDGYQLLYDKVYENMDKFIITIGGDHSIAAGNVGAIVDYYNIVKNKKIFILWIDAHTDINTYETSSSKNTHGMPVAFLMHLCKQNIVNLKTKLEPYQIIYIGVRDIDPPEKKLLEELNIKYFTNQYINSVGIYNVINEIQNIIGDEDIHISLDVDGIDPKYCPSTGITVENGLSIDNIIDIIDSYNKQLVSFDVTEYNPFETSLEDSDLTKKNINKIIKFVVNSRKNFYQ